MAMVEAAKILRKHINPFVQYSEMGPQVHSQARGSGGVDPKLEAKLNMTINDLKLSVRATNCLESENIRSVRELVGYNEDSLMEVRNFGETTLVEVQEKLQELELRLGMKVPPAPSPM
jgi:DNA-directed RNA polymerase subunit alpha